jgi:cytochrome c553
MRARFPIYAFAAMGLIFAGSGSIPAGEAKKTPSAAAAQFFETKVRPILVENCYSCHGEKKQRGSLRVDSLGALLEGGETSPAIVVGHPEKSLLMKAISYEDKELKMPPTKKMAREQIDILEQWVKMGAPWPGSEKAVAPPRKGEFQITDKDRSHWSFQPVKRPDVPKGRKQEWVRNPIDAFILTGLEAKGMHPNGPASKLELLRRVTYDLTGLPPTPEEVDAYVKDNAPDAYEKLVDRLLASPRYGEKWARGWLDLVHYAETNSYERDNPKPHVWRYRDYVIRSFNEDKPYDRFLKEQLAGDEMFPGDPDALIATGYYRLGIWDDEPSDPKQSRYDGLDDIVATTSQTMLGLTIDCARCHNHKLDPIAQKDYYRLLAFFHNINHFRNGGPTDERPIGSADQRAAFEKASKELEEKRSKLQGTITAIENEFRKKHKQSQSLIGTDLDDLSYRFYRNAWMKLPDFTQFKHEDEGKLPKKLFDLSPRTRDEAIGFVFEGVLIVPEAGRYTFFLDSDDGSRLTVNGKTLITYDGIHGVGNVQKQEVDLPRGRLPIKLEYFQNVFGFGLQVAWSGPGFEQRLLSAPEKTQKTLDLAKLLVSEGAKVLGAEKVAEYQKLKKQLIGLQKPTMQPRSEMALCVTESGTRAPETFVMVRGNPHVLGDKVEPGFPSVFGLPRKTTRSRRA